MTIFFRQNNGLFNLIIHEYHIFHLVAENIHTVLGIDIMLYSVALKFFTEVIDYALQAFFDISFEEKIEEIISYPEKIKILKLVAIGSAVFFLLIISFVFIETGDIAKASILKIQ